MVGWVLDQSEFFSDFWIFLLDKTPYLYLILKCSPPDCHQWYLHDLNQSQCDQCLRLASRRWVVPSQLPVVEGSSRAEADVVP